MCPMNLGVRENWKLGAIHESRFEECLILFLGTEFPGLRFKNTLSVRWPEAGSIMAIKVIIDKSRGEVSLLEQDTIKNVS